MIYQEICLADRPRFGPAGVPSKYRVSGATVADVPGLLREEGLDALEYEAVRWGKKPQMRQEDAETLGIEAEVNDVWLSMHGSYFINLCGEKTVLEASKLRLVACATAAHWMKAHVVVFHPGFYGRKTPREALKMCLEAINEVVQTLRSRGIVDVKIGPETMGRVHQLGTLDEVLDLCESAEQTQLVIDWSHLYARSGGRMKKIDDFRRIIGSIEQKLGTDAAKNMHCHFTKIEFTPMGERRHHALDNPRYGPNFELLAQVIKEFELRPVIISESPILEIDALRMRDILQRIMA